MLRAMTQDAKTGERIAKALARAGVGSRREVERMIAAGRVAIAGQVLDSPAHNIADLTGITVDGRPVAAAEPPRLWRYHKPPGLVTTHRDPEGRPTVFDDLPGHLPRVISVGRLDLNSEGLLLLTNDGGLARWLELPETGWSRRYRVRAHGRVDEAALRALSEGTEVEGIVYGPVEARLDSVSGSNVWLTVALREGKKREVRHVLASIGLRVNRLIRVAYGPFTLGSLPRQGVAETPKPVLYNAIRGYFDAADSSPGAAPRPDMSKWAKAKPKPTKPAARRRKPSGARAAPRPKR